jgi:hypothetical protein
MYVHVCKRDCLNDLKGVLFAFVQAGFNGGGMLSQFPVVAINTSFHHNEAGRLGGGIHVNSKAYFNCTACNFWNNSAAMGGAMSSSDTASEAISINIKRSQFLSNRALKGGAIDMKGSLSCSDVVFKGNKAGKGGALSLASETDVTPLSKLERCQFLHNNAASEGGGAVINTQGDVVFLDCKWEGNSAGSSGGGLALGQHKGRLRLVDSSFISNRVSSGGGGALSVTQHSDPIIMVGGCTFKSNQVRNLAVSISATASRYGSGSLLKGLM